MVRAATGADGEHVHSLVWVEPGRDARGAAEEELGHAFDEALHNLRDLEGLAIWPEDAVDAS